MEGGWGGWFIKGGRIETRQDQQNRKQGGLESRLFTPTTAIHSKTLSLIIHRAISNLCSSAAL